MDILITGGCGFIGSNLSIFLKKNNLNVFTLDNLYRTGSKFNLLRLKQNKIKNFKIDIRDNNLLKKLPKFDLVIDCCAEPSVESSRKSEAESRRVFETNLVGTFNIVQKCVKDNSKLIFLSTSRVYSIIKLKKYTKFINSITYNIAKINLIDEDFDTSGPLSLYGYSKLSSENLITEFSYSHGLEFIINRFGVVSGPWQFGKTDQGFVSFWCWNFLNKKKLIYKGYSGKGSQIRDLLHVNDLCELLLMQIKNFPKVKNETFAIGGGKENFINLRQLSKEIESLTNIKKNIKGDNAVSIYDVPYYISSNRKIFKYLKWKPKYSVIDILVDVINWQVENKKKLLKYF